MSIFEAVLAKKADMAGGGAPPPEDAPQAPLNSNMGTLDQAIMDAKTQLNDLLKQYPDIDYAGKYMELQNQVQNQQVPEHPLDTPGEAAKGLAYAFGAPKAAPAIMNQQIARHDEGTDKKQQDLTQIKMSLLGKSLEAEEKKGNFKMALKQADALDTLQRAEADRKRALDLKEWEQKQKVKTADARTLLKQKTANIVASFHLKEKMQLEVMKFAEKLLAERMRQKSILGTPIEDIPAEDLLSDIMPQVEEMAQKLIAGESITPPKINTEAPATKPQSPYAKALEEIRARKGN